MATDDREKRGSTRVLFVCTGNACRSPMAEGLAKDLGLDAESAGVLAAGIHPRAVQAMRERGIDIVRHVSRAVPDVDAEYDVVVTLCDYARSVHPDAPRARRARLHWPVEDPIHATGSDEEIRAAFRKAREEIEALIRKNLLLLRGVEQA